MALCILYLAARNLSALPAPWYDEGVNLQAARTLARSGVYGLVYDTEPRPFDVQLTTGPTVIAPIALLFKVAGVGLARGRTVMLAYTLLAAVGLYLAARLFYGHVTALVALLVLCATDLAGPASTRDVVGEIAALAFLFWGVAGVAFARATNSHAWHLGAGLCLGLAAVSKGQFALLVPGVVLAWIVSQRHLTAWRLQHAIATLVGLLLPIGAWQAVQVFVLGVDGFALHLQEQSAAVGVSAGVPFLSQTVANSATLLESRLALPGLVGLVYLTLCARSAERLLVAAFACLWLVWYLAFSVGYARYNVPLLGVLALCLAVLVCDLCAAARGVALRTATALLLGVPVAAGLAANVLAVSQPPDLSAQEMAFAISRVAEADEVTESLEWELDVLTERRLHHPPPFVPHVPYAVPSTTRFLVDGPASKATRLYVEHLAREPYEKIAVVGQYDLYRRVPRKHARRHLDPRG